MDYKILRGKNQIGGSVTEVFTGSVRVLVDFGADLSPETSTDAALIQTIREDPPDAVFFTHIHGDHIGLLYALPPQVKQIFLGPVARRMLLNIRQSLLASRNLSEEERYRLQTERDILLDDRRTKPYANGVPITIGDMTVIPIRTDHSVFDSYMLRFSAQGKVILHTGDFRTHGRLGENLFNTAEAMDPVDVLITEGTMLSRAAEEVLTERQLQAAATKLLKQHKYAFLLCSSTNVESLASFYWAMVESGRSQGRRPPFLVSPYAKQQLALYTQAIGESQGLREFAFYRSYPIQDSLRAVLPNGKTQKQHMLDEGFLMLVGTGPHYRALMEEFREQAPLVIYSMWKGYLIPGKPYSDSGLISLADAWKDHFVCLHTSGHAAANALAELIRLLEPREAIVPIHTENPEGFFHLDIPQHLKERLRL